MNIKDFIKNKDINLTNDDIDMVKLENTIRKGYVSESTVNDNYISKKDYTDLETKHTDLTTKYSDLENNFNGNVTKLEDTNKQLSKITLEKTMMGVGFKEDDFEDIAKLRSSLYADEKDDKVAINQIKEKYKATYFPVDNSSNTTTPPPNEAGLGGANGSGNGADKNSEIKITRSTSISDLMIPKK